MLATIAEISARSARRLGLLTLLWSATTAHAQYGPPASDGNYDESSELVFLDQELTEVIVTMDPADLQAILDDPFSDVYQRATVRVVNSQLDETVLDVGIRARGNTARDNEKFPWKLSFNEFVQGRRFHGVKKFNLASDAGDPTLARSKVLWDAYRAMGVPASRAHHVRLNINDGAVLGVYLNVEQVDDDFVDAWFGSDEGELYKCRYKDIPANLAYIEPGTPETYQAFESYEEEIGPEDFGPLAELIDFLENSDDMTFMSEIADRVNVDGLLRAMASDVASGNWDGYWFGANNYYLYLNPETGRYEYVPWDLDQAFGMDYFFFPLFFGTDWARRPWEIWANGGFGGDDGMQPVLMRRLLEIPLYEEQLLRYVHQAIERPLGLGANDAKLSDVEARLGSVVFSGTFSGPTMDWGYDVDDFLHGFDEPDEYQALNIPTTWGVRPFMRTRLDYVRDNYPSPAPLPPLFVNEVVADNEGLIADEAGQFEDYLELYNGGDVDLDVGGYYLSDYAGEPRKWRIPDGTTVPARGFLLVWADEDPLDGPLHAEFKLSNDGEGVWLFAPDAELNRLVDYLSFPALGDDESFGRLPDGAAVTETLSEASPVARNAGVDPAFELTVEGGCPSRAVFWVSGAESGERVAVGRASGEGSLQVPSGGCAGTLLGLDGSAGVLAQATADVNGTARLEVELPEAFCGGTFFQALGLTGCATSEVVSR